MKSYLATICLLIGISNIVSAQTGLSIMQRYDSLQRVDDQTIELTMTLVSANGKKRQRQLNWFTREELMGRTMSLIRFNTPADIAGSGFLSIEYPDKSEDKWLYLPALKKSRRLSSTEQSNSFMGSDFAYEDIESETLSENLYTLMGKETVDGRSCYKIEAVPANAEIASKTSYAKRLFFIDIEKYAVVKIQYYNAAGTNSKTLSASDIRQVSGSMYRSFYLTMDNHSKGSSTVLEFKSLKINTGIDENRFTKRELETN